MSRNTKEENTEQLSEEELLAQKKQERRKDNISMLITVLVTLVLFECIFVLHKIPSSSMEPTIRTRSIAVCWRLPYLLGDPTPEHGDIVSFRDPDSSKILIKRVIGLPGDVIEFDGQGNVFRNGEQLEEPYLLEQQVTFAPKAQYTVPEGCFFAMGDNRESSADSRFKNTTYMQITGIYAKELFSFYAPIFFIGSKY